MVVELPTIASNIETKMILLFANTQTEKRETTIDNISIYNMQGQKILLENLNIKKIEISDFEKGLYFIKISIGNNRYVKKIIKI